MAKAKCYTKRNRSRSRSRNRRSNRSRRLSKKMINGGGDDENKNVYIQKINELLKTRNENQIEKINNNKKWIEEQPKRRDRDYIRTSKNVKKNQIIMNDNKGTFNCVNTLYNEGKLVLRKSYTKKKNCILNCKKADENAIKDMLHDYNAQKYMKDLEASYNGQNDDDDDYLFNYIPVVYKVWRKNSDQCYYSIMDNGGPEYANFLNNLDMKKKKEHFFDFPSHKEDDNLIKTKWNYILVQIMKYLKYSEKKGFIQNDVKPENMLYESKEGIIKIIDFGFKRDIGKLRKNYDKSGTPIYVDTYELYKKSFEMMDDLFKFLLIPFVVLYNYSYLDDEKNPYQLYYNFNTVSNKFNNNHQNENNYYNNVLKILIYFIKGDGEFDKFCPNDNCDDNNIKKNLQLCYNTDDINLKKHLQLCDNNDEDKIFTLKNKSNDDIIKFVYNLFQKGGITKNYLKTFESKPYIKESS